MIFCFVLFHFILCILSRFEAQDRDCHRLANTTYTTIKQNKHTIVLIANKTLVVACNRWYYVH